MGTRIRTHITPKMRIISFVLAFVMVFVGLPYVGIDTDAADSDSSIVTSSKTADVSGSPHVITGGTAKYTGKILDYADSSVDLFDYMSDQELNSSDGKTITDSHASGFTDQHTYLNTAISNDGEATVTVSEKENNLTIYYEEHNSYSGNTAPPHTVYVYLFGTGGNNTGWTSCPMQYDNSLGLYKYTWIYDDIGWIPTHFIIHGNDRMGEWQTDDIPCDLNEGNSYKYSAYKTTSRSENDNQVYIKVNPNLLRAIQINGANKRDQGLHLTGTIRAHMWDDGGSGSEKNVTLISSGAYLTGTVDTSGYTGTPTLIFQSTKYLDKNGNAYSTDEWTAQSDAYVLTKNKNYTFDSVTDIVSGAAEDIMGKTYKYYKPLYFGCFWRATFNDAGKANYNNFYWQPNISLQNNHSYSSVQGLVDPALGSQGQLLQGTQELPYFSKSLADSDHYKYTYNGNKRNMINYYEDLDFMFYEIQTDASNVLGHEAGDSGKARFYQFNSKETNLYFNGTQFTESDKVIKSQGTQNDAGGTIGFYPFNNEENKSQKNNLAFGAKFTIDFKLGEEGKIETLQSNGNGTGKYVNEVFEFEGDDDVWVFIDGNLVLDLGGVHKDTKGYIDFAQRKAVATSATTYTDANRDNLNVAVSEKDDNKNTNIGTESETFAFTDLLKDKDYYRTNHKYNPETKHTMTLFYMERGMYESDLLVRFNFETVSNKNTLKISEVTDFTDVNEGLRSITQKAADNDVFQYTVYNKGTVNDEIRNSEILTPTFDTYTRSNSGYSTKLSGLETITYSDSESIFLNDPNEICDYDGAKLAAWYTIGTGSDRYLCVGRAVNVGDVQHTYKFSVPYNATKVRFLRLNTNGDEVDNTTLYPDKNNYPPNGYIWKDITSSSFSPPTKGALYTIGGSRDTPTVTRTKINYSIAYSPTVTRTTHNYTPGSTLPNPLEYVAVTNTNYLLTDGFSTKTGTDGKPLAGTTDETTGIFPLMYGTNGTGGTTQKESSALFKYQFKTDSDMKVVQSNTLAKPADREHAPFTTSTSARNVSSYYKTSVTIKDKYGQVVTDAYDDRDFSSGNAETTFDYVNSQTTQTNYPKDPVEITEEFTNRVLVGAISVKKELVYNTEPGDTFNFTLELTDVLGQDGVDVTDYNTIKVSVDGATPVAGKITTSGGKGTFTLTKGQTLTIYGIPAGTKYNITEETPTDNYQKKQDNGKMSGTVKQGVLKEGQSDYSSYTHYDPHGDNKVVVTNERRVGDLTLTKALVGEENADTLPTNETPYTLKVTLNAPTGVNLNNYFSSNTPTITTSGTQTGVISEVATYSNDTYEFNVTVYPKDGSHNNTVTVKNIPYGTTYTVEEVFSEANHPSPKYTYTEGNGTSYTSKICNDTTVVNVTNIYRKVTMTKKDNKDTSKTLSGAEYILVRLKDDAYETVSGHTVLKSDAITAFNKAKESDFTATLLDPASPADLSTYVDGYSSVLTTGTHDGSAQNDGVVVVNDSMMTGGLKPGQYFFIELTAPSDYYEKNNNSSIDYNDNGSTATQYKVFEIADTIPSNLTETRTAINYYDERKLCALIVQEDVLSSTVNAYAASANQNFDVLVTLDGTVSGIDIDPREFLTNDYLTNTIGATSTSINRDDNKKLSFTVPVSKSGGQKNILGLPLGVKYTVSQTLPSTSVTPSGSSWKKVSDNSNLNSSITSDSENETFVHPLTLESVTYPTKTARITNAMVGSLVLSKALAYGTTNTENRTFDFNVNMTIPDDVTIYTLQRTVGTGSASNITGLSGHDITISQTMSVGTDVTISNVPYGTTYSVEETEPGGDWGIINQVNTTNNTINNTTKTTTITNGKVGKLNLNKIIAGEYKKNGVNVGDDFEFEVTLTNTVNSLSNVKVNGVAQTVTSGDSFSVNVTSIKTGDAAKTVVISNIPHGTQYTVIEASSSRPPTGGTVTNEVSTEATLNNDVTVTITNTYPMPDPITVTINMTKTDAETGTAITNSDETKRAKYRLLKLTEAFQTAYENDPTSVSNDFKNSSSYSDAVLNSYISATASADKTVDENGTVTFSSSEISALGNVYPGDIFFLYETKAPDGYKVDNSVNDGKLITIVKGTTSYSVRYTDEPESMDVNLLKTDDSNNPLAGAQFDLYFKESYNPPTNSINESEISPKLLASKSVSGTAPEPPAVSNSTTIKSTKYNYTKAEAPDASESTWILPRTDNDYIYFRDYNISSSQYSGDDNGRWINTWFNTNEFGQSKEIFYDHRYWLKAVFTASGKETREYSVWERFVDHYDGQETVVWKIQPPDGYEYVEFILCDGANNNNHVRNTEKFKYVLGNIYTKTNKGKYDNGQYGYPVKGEHWSTYWDSAKHSSDPPDHRITYSTSTPNTKQYVFGQSSKDGGSPSTLGSMAQADRYIATPQKLVFHCNSKVVWHNIHIEFFDKNQQPIGQEFPGYMMEPYAYAGNDYRINGYLTYELTIPKDAKYFRVNDGITMDTTYGYYSRITEIYSGDTNKYYKIDGSYTNSNQKNIKLVQSTSFATNSGKKYTNQNEIESDYDYIYFATPKTGGWDKVYAHFYGGGDLQADNWQRACYSIWPGLAPVGTEYKADENGTKNVEHHSDIYGYTTNPDSTFEWKDGNTTYTVYKFRIPLGDRTNYKKVIFNNGLSKSSGGKLTSPIEYSAGYIYKKSGSPTKHYEEKNTYTYTGRGDELYVKMNNSTLEKWDDLHITFYDSGKNQILQGKDGYVMKYSGTDTSGNTYFSMLIPSNAAYFSLNNGIGKSDPHNLSLSGKYEILPLNASGDENTSQNFTKGNMVYTLNDSTLSKTLPEFTEDTSSSEVTLDAYPSPRGDYIYIKDVGGNTLISPPPTFKFYNSSGSELTSPGVNTHAAYGSDKWYSVGIPTDAVKFSMNDGSTKYDIYQKTTETTTSDLNMNFTPGNMYYSATGNQTLSLIWPTFSNTSEATNYNDDNWSNTKRSDALYLVCADKSDWNGMTVTFYDAGGTAIKNSSNVSNIRANYVGELVSGNPAVSGQSTTNEDAVGHWFKVKIPDNAKTFVAKAGDSKETVSGDIYEYRTKTARYRTDYTLGDMQYRISNTGTGSSPTVHTLTRFYPIFTQDAVYTMPDNDDVSSTSGSTLVDESQVLDSYVDNSPAAPTTTSGTSDEPVLHATASNTITYTWQEGGSSSGGTLYYDNSSTLWSTVYVHLWGGTNSTEWTGKKMNDEGNNIWSFALTGTDGSGSYDYSDSKCCIFNANSNDDKTLNLKLPNDISSKNYLYGSTKVWGTGSYVYFKQPDGAFSNNSSQSWRDLKVEFTDSNNNTETLSDIIKYVGSSNLQIVGQTSTISSYWKIFVDPTKNWRKIKFIRASDTSTTTVTVDLFDYGSGYGVGNYFTLSTYKQGEENSLNSVQQVKEKDRQFSEYAATVTYSSQFQPEDRYGYIQNAANQFDTNGTTATTNNFVKVVNDVSGLTDLHIKFFNNSDGADSHRVDTVDSTVTGSVISPYGIKLKPDTVFTTYPAIDSTQYTPATGPYYVRLPKNAKYAQLYNGSTAVGSMVDLADSSGKTGGITLTISGDSSSQTVSKSYVSRGDTGIQVNAKKTDMDYIYFTDENGTMSGIRAYYFGDADGEYCAWPSVAPSYSYTDSNGKTVYAFQYPTREGSTGKAYPYVIFNSGGTYPSSTMTIALNYSGSGNYSISTDTTRYGTNDSTAINAKHTNVTPKTDNPTVNYSTNNKYIFFVNNGTYNFSQLSDTRYTLDDVHIEFFDMNKTPLQTTAPGYVMDKIGTYSKDSTSGDLYRIAIPSNAQYFRINNGTGKGSGTTKYNVRNSVIEEIAANGIYKFVDESNATADVWDGSAPSSAADLDDHNYKLKLINEKQPDPEDDDIIEPRNYEVRLARVETKNSANSDNGNISKIIWLKPAVGYEEENPQTTFDSEYLDYEGIDIAAFLASNNDAAVKVKKRGTYYWKETKVPTGYKIPDGESDEKIFIIEDRSHPIANIGTVTFINEKLPEPTNKVILTKTAKEKVGDNDVGATLTGAKFLLYVNDGDSNDSNDTLAGTFNQAKDASNNNISGEYTYVSSGGAFNTNASDSTKYMETGNVISDTDHYGKLTLNGLPVGDYYLKEMTAPTGYSEIDSNTGTNKRVYFSIGDNTVEKELVCADEMAPAYIRLFEHVNDLMIDEWGHPTFVFKITNTTTNKTNLVSLTFDGTTLTEEKIAATVKWYNNGTAVNYGEGNDPIDDSKYADWYVEGTTESEYKGVYHIDSQGRIKVEPGTYSITRVPVSRYEFVTSGNLVYTTDTEPTETYTVNSSGTETAETVTLTAGKTADVHYYDKVGYYDKFSHVDEQINKFYKLENGANKTIKGIRIKDYHQVGTTGTEADTNDSDTMTVSVEKLTIYKIMSDGSEAAMTSEEKAALTNFNITYTYDSATGDKREFGGKAATEGDPAIPAQFSYANNTITVIEASDFENGVYTLNAEYKGFTAKFDLVFSRT